MFTRCSNTLCYAFCKSEIECNDENIYNSSTLSGTEFEILQSDVSGFELAVLHLCYCGRFILLGFVCT